MTLLSNLPVLPVLVPLVSAVAALVSGWYDRRAARPIVILALALDCALAVLLLSSVVGGGPISYHLGGYAPPLGIEFAVDLLNAFVLAVVLPIMLLAVVFAGPTVGREVPAEKAVSFYVLLLLLATGICGMTLTGDIFNLYVFLEITSLAAYALIAAGREQRSLVASYRYMIMGSLSAGFILLGTAHLYVATGTLNMADLASRLATLYDSTLVHTAFAFFLVGLTIKTALFPLHLWLPGAYAYAPSPVSIVISTAVAKVSAYATLRVLFSVFTTAFIVEYFPITDVLLWLAAIAIIAGSVVAIAQTDVKKMLAYSSVSQMGYIMFGIGVADPVAMAGAVFQILGHAVAKGALFASVGSVIALGGPRDVRGLAGLAARMPVTAAVFAVGAASMIGIPGTAGFVSKFLLALGAVESGRWVFAGVILASSLLTAVYFWRVIEVSYFADEADPRLPAKEAPLSMIVPAALLAAACVLFGIAPDIPLSVIEPAVLLLLGGGP